MMKAVVMAAYGPPEVLQLREAAVPVVGNRDVLVRVRAASVNYGDLLARDFRAVTPRKFNMPFPLWILARLYFGFGRPRVRVLGSEFAGDVEAVGRDVRRFKAGDAVFGYVGQAMGAYAEYLRVPESGALALKPADMTYEEAAVVPYGAVMALPLLGKQGIRPGRKVLVVGASGGIGSAAVQIARHLGAEVTGVCAAPGLDYVKALGAHRVIDYTREDFAANGETYDLIFDVLGRSSFSRCKNSLSKNGRYLRASFKARELWQMLWTAVRGGRRVLCAFAPGSREDLLAVAELIDAGKIKAIVDRSFPLARAAEAHRYVEQGHKKGGVAVTVERAGNGGAGA